MILSKQYNFQALRCTARLPHTAHTEIHDVSNFFLWKESFIVGYPHKSLTQSLFTRNTLEHPCEFITTWLDTSAPLRLFFSFQDIKYVDDKFDK